MATEETGPAGAEGHAADAAGHGSAGLPQLDFDTWPSQIFWLAVALWALYQLLTKIALPRISGVLEERADAIADDLDRAEEFKRKAEEAKATYDKALAEARAKAEAIASETRAAIQAEVDAEMARADEEIAARTAESERRLQEFREQAAESIGTIAEEAAQSVVETVMPGLAEREGVQSAVRAELN